MDTICDASTQQGEHASPRPETAFTVRLATRADLPALEALMRAAIDQLQRPFLDARQIAASHRIMGADAQLIDDGTYFVVECDGELAGCGGWSRRATRYAGDHTRGGGDGEVLDPARDAARIRAMYTHPRFARRGVGSLVLTCAERAAAAEGFRRLELVATLSGEPLYRSYGFEVIEPLTDTSTGTSIPALAMQKAIVRPDG